MESHRHVPSAKRFQASQVGLHHNPRRMGADSDWPSPHRERTVDTVGFAMTSKGFPDATKALIRRRAGGWCERCGWKRATEFHHRRPRGMGGSRQADTNTPSNALLLDRDCHADIESERGEAIDQGWLVTQNHSAADIPVRYRGDWVFLDDLGNLNPVQEALL